MFPEELGRRFGDYVRSIRNDGYKSGSKKEIMDEINKHLKKSVAARMEGRKTGIAFSGGLDSTMIAKSAFDLKKDFLLLSVGFENSQDIKYARKIAGYYGWPLKIRIISMDDAEKIVKNVVGMLKTDDIVKIGVGCVVYSVLELARDNNVDVVFGGLGAEEIFAGYDRHRKKYIENPEDVHEECWRGLENLYQQDLKRDSIIAGHFGIRLLAPFLDDEMIKYAMKIDPRLKVSENDRKIILKETALHIGIINEFAMRKKKAAQYGSYFHQALNKLARSNGCKTRKDYIHSITR